MKHVVKINLPPAPVLSDDIQQSQEEINRYVDQLNQVLSRSLNNIYHDLALGQSRFQRMNAEVSATRLSVFDLGQLAFRTSGSDHFLLTRLSTGVGSIKPLTLSSF